MKKFTRKTLLIIAIFASMLNSKVCLTDEKQTDKISKIKKVLKYWPFTIPVAGLGLGLVTCLICRNCKNKQKINHTEAIDKQKDDEIKKLGYESRKHDWCAIASIVNSLKSCGIKMTQEEIVKRIKVKFPKFPGGGFDPKEYIDVCKEIAQENKIFFHHVRLECYPSVIKTKAGYKCEKPINTNAFKVAILKFYELIGKIPFFIDDSHYDPVTLGHMVNVVDIQNGNIKIFDNLGVGYIRNENIDDFVKKYLDRLKTRPSVRFVMGGFSDKYNDFTNCLSWLAGHGSDEKKIYATNSNGFAKYV